MSFPLPYISAAVEGGDYILAVIDKGSVRAVYAGTCVRSLADLIQQEFPSLDHVQTDQGILDAGCLTLSEAIQAAVE